MNPLFAFDGVRHLPEDALLPPLSRCPLCGSRAWHAAFTVQPSPEVTLNRCRNCGGASVSRMPAPTALDVFYADFYAETEGAQVTFGGVERFGRYLYRYVQRLALRDGVRILDFGGGDGAIAVALAERIVAGGASNVEVVVADFGDSLANPGSPGIRVRREASLESVEPGFAHVVLASGVLEHVPDPVGTARKLLERVDAGGLFYARTPHVLPFMQVIRHRAAERFFPFPAHLHDLGQTFWTYCFSNLLDGTGCRLVRSRPAIVQASFREHGRIALASYVMKAPWWLLGHYYPFVGGWEVVARR